MTLIALRPVDPDLDFPHIAALFTLEQDEPTTPVSLRADYEAHKERIYDLSAAVDEQGALLGFDWAVRNRIEPDEAYFYLIVDPQHRGQGAGSRLYAELERASRAAGFRKLFTTVRDDCPACLTFALRRGFSERTHSIGMALDLARFDPTPYNAHVEALCAQGFEFTTMHALGNTEEAQRRLYALNDTAASETPGSGGDHPWQSFEDFQSHVCGASWYNPAGQFVVIDRASGDWAAMSAVTRFEGADYAYNLFTGVDRRYRGRKLAQAVKGLALQFARGALAVQTVRTHHNAQNDPMLAIDRKMGYTTINGYYSLEKPLT